MSGAGLKRAEPPARAGAGVPSSSVAAERLLIPQLEPLLETLLEFLRADRLSLVVLEDSDQPAPFRRALRIDLAQPAALVSNLHEQTDRAVASLLDCRSPRISNVEDTHGVLSSICVPLSGPGGGDGVIELIRHAPRPVFRRMELDALSELAPGLSLSLHALLNCRWSQLYATTFETLQHGIALIDARRSLQGCNAAMQQALDRADGIRLVDGRVIARTPREDQSLAQAVRRVLGERRERALLEIERPGCPLPYALLIRADGPAAAFGRDDPLLLRITLADPACLGTEAMRQIGAAIGLTASERDVALSMVQGHDVPEIAARMQIATNTVRWHQKRIFSKTGARGRTELALRLTHALSLFGAATNP
jgi:DNA-binding CsgD family transcriptional regulator